MFNIKFWRWLDSNHGPLESEATAIPTVPQPMPVHISFASVSAYFYCFCPYIFCISLCIFFLFWPFRYILPQYLYLYAMSIYFFLLCNHHSTHSVHTLFAFVSKLLYSFYLCVFYNCVSPLPLSMPMRLFPTCLCLFSISIRLLINNYFLLLSVYLYLISMYSLALCIICL